MWWGQTNSPKVAKNIYIEPYDLIHCWYDNSSFNFRNQALLLARYDAEVTWAHWAGRWFLLTQRTFGSHSNEVWIPGHPPVINAWIWSYFWCGNSKLSAYIKPPPFSNLYFTFRWHLKVSGFSQCGQRCVAPGLEQNGHAEISSN